MFFTAAASSDARITLLYNFFSFSGRISMHSWGLCVERTKRKIFLVYCLFPIAMHKSILFRLVRLLDSVRISTNGRICWFLLHVLRLRHATTIADSTDSILGIDGITAAQPERDFFGSGTWCFVRFKGARWCLHSRHGKFSKGRSLSSRENK